MADANNSGNNWEEENIPDFGKNNQKRFDDDLNDILGDLPDESGNISKKDSLNIKNENEFSYESDSTDNDALHKQLFGEKEEDEENPLLEGYLPNKNDIDDAVEDLEKDNIIPSSFEKDDPLSGLGGGTQDTPQNKDESDKSPSDDNSKNNNDSKDNKDKKDSPDSKGEDTKSDKGKNPLEGMGNSSEKDKNNDNDSEDNNKSEDKSSENDSPESNDSTNTGGKVDDDSEKSKNNKENPLAGMGAGAEGSNGHAESSSDDKSQDEESKEEPEPKKPAPPQLPGGSSNVANKFVAPAAAAAGVSLMAILAVIFMIFAVIAGASGGGEKGAAPSDAEMGTCMGTGSENSGSDGEAGVPKGKKSNPEKIPPAQLTSGFEMRWGTMHKGQDLATPETGDKVPIYAWYDGTVVKSGTADGFGNWIVIEHEVDGKTLSTVYGHMKAEDLLVKEGDEVKSGQKISYQGNEGFSTGPHLHFEVHTGPWDPNNAVDPKPYLKDAVNPGENAPSGNHSKDEDSKKDTKPDSGESGGDSNGKIINYDKLKPNAKALAKAVEKEFPDIQTIGGWRESDPWPDHPSGHAVDIMIPDYSSSKGIKLGTSIEKWVIDNKKDFDVTYTIWRSEYHPSDGPKSPYTEGAGDDTTEHRDHVHVTVGDAKASGQASISSGSTEDGESISCCAATATNPSSQFTDAGNKQDQEANVEDMIKMIIAVGRELGMDEDAIKIALVTAEDESGFRNYANDGGGGAQAGASDATPQEVAESLKYPHDAVAHDGNSVGPFQQQVGDGYWGKVPDLMLPAYQAGQFYSELKMRGYKGKPYEVAASEVQGNRDGSSVYAKFLDSAEQNYKKYEKDAKLKGNEKEDSKRGFDTRSKKNGTAQGDSKEESSSSSSGGSPDSSNAGCAA